MAAKKRPAAKASKRTTSARAATAAPRRKATAAPRGATKTVTAKAGRATAAGATRGVKAAAAKAATSKASSVDDAPIRKKAPSKAAAPRRAAAKSGSAATPAGATPSLGEGDRAPAFSLSDQSGAPVSSDDLAGKPYVLYFYPKDDTPGCTTEACGFRDSISEFDGIGVRVLGVSPDSVATHQKFVGKYGLPFTLLSDSARELAGAYGVWALKKLYGRESMGIVRSTFLVDGEGVLRKVWRNVRVAGHVPEVQAAAARLG
jgi:peroxiredoxin Q/BCP